MRLIRMVFPIVAMLGAMVLAAPTLAKMDAEAMLDTPIARDAAPGSMIDVGWSVFSIVGDARKPLYGSPIYIRLVSPDGRATTEVMGTESPSGSGHYTASIQVPAGGIGEVIVGLVGEACDANGCRRSDVIFPLTDDPLVTGAAPSVEAPASTAPVATLLVPIVVIGTAVAIAGALAAVVVGRRRTVGADAAGR